MGRRWSVFKRRIDPAILLWAGFGLPLASPQGWQLLSFKNIPANQVEFKKEGLFVKVNKSSNPMVYPLGKKPLTVYGLKVQGSLTGRPQIPQGKTQGEKGADDFALKVGLVRPGQKRLSWWQRQVSPDWVLRLSQLAPADQGLKVIQFFSLVEQKKLLGSRRSHPLSSLIQEEFTWYQPKAKKLDLTVHFKKPLKAFAVWLAFDGDDTQSSFQVQMRQVILLGPEDVEKPGI